MQSGGGKLGAIAGIVLAVFGISTIILLKIMPPPRRDVDYLVAGSIATLVALLVVFVLLLATGQKPSSAFFTKQRPEE